MQAAPITILAFDTAVTGCAVAVWRDGVTLAEDMLALDRGQAEHLVPMIEAVMIRAGVSFDALSRIAVTVGPGSFTGVRVGLATARGFGLARNIPVIGVTTGTVLAADARARCPQAKTIVSLIDSKRGDLYVEVFADGAAVVEARSMPLAEIEPWFAAQNFATPVVLVGDGAPRVPTLGDILENSATPSAAALAAVAAREIPQADGPVPLYVRPPDVTMPPGPALPTP